MDMMVVDIALNFSGLFGERLEIRFHQPDMDGVAILPSDRELVSRIGLLEPCPYQCHDFRRMLPLVIAAFQRYSLYTYSVYSFAVAPE